MTALEVRVGDVAWRKVAGLGERSGDGNPSHYDFIGGPLAAALIGFRAFHRLPHAAGPSVRQFDVLDPVFGPVYFIGVLLLDDIVEIADFAIDDGYWDAIGGDPEP